MEDIKQVIVIRKDLNMRKGKMCAQAAHASMKVFFDRLLFYNFDIVHNKEEVEHLYALHLTPEMKKWKDGIFTKIVVGCDTEDELRDIYNAVNEAGIPNALIEDSGLTEFNYVPTFTCIAIGPEKSEIIDKYTVKFS